MWLYGIYFAEGSQGLSLNKKETEYINKIKYIWKNKTGLNVTTRLHKNDNGIDVCLQSVQNVYAIFCNAMEIGHKAKNKSLSYLCKLNNKELIRGALEGLFAGDGNIDGKGKISLGLCNKKAICDVAFLLQKWFNIKSNLYTLKPRKAYFKSKSTTSKQKYINSGECYMLVLCCQADILKLFPNLDKNNFKYKESKYSVNHKTSPIICKEIKQNSTIPLYDITISGGSHIFPINGYLLTHNCNGNEPIHLDLELLLDFCKERNILANLTVQENTLLKHKEQLEEWLNKGLIHGIGISPYIYSNEMIKFCKDRDTAVIHTIAGITSINDYERLMNKDLKILILGYKDFGKGISYATLNPGRIERLIEQLADNIKDFPNHFKVVSFDNLAIQQLDPKSFLTEEEWKTFYRGGDGNHTFYIDLVNETFAKNSVQGKDKHKSLLNNVKDMMKVIQGEKDE